MFIHTHAHAHTHCDIYSHTYIYMYIHVYMNTSGGLCRRGHGGGDSERAGHPIWHGIIPTKPP